MPLVPAVYAHAGVAATAVSNTAIILDGLGLTIIGSCLLYVPVQLIGLLPTRVQSMSRL